MKTANKTATQALAANHFTSFEGFMSYLDKLLERLVWAYAGVHQLASHRVCDYDLIRKLKQAIAQDLQGVDVQFNPPPLLPPYESDLAIRPCLWRPAIDSMAKATRLAKARGLSNFEVKKHKDDVYLVIYCTLNELDQYPYPIWGAFNEAKQALIVHNLHLI
ncbi:hypothetical protein [Microscilla marina]|uniref:Uncharacterized protein n=1 Tax=Microscilla marina ATCC 23134 TaxID=313606 RepID=A1ZQT6_MICM2|nr:hypothetical protein [Microscilla marina]EAY27241.1 hypothetical protein M23134_06551 [Microscilla marina ATCC 23134]